MNRSPSLLALFICALALPGLAGCGSKSSPSDNGSGSTSSPALDGGVLNCSVSVESGDYDYSVTNNTLTITVDGQSQAPLTRIGAAPSSPTYPLLGSWQEPQSITNGLQISIALTFTESTLTANSTCVYQSLKAQATATSPVSYTATTYSIEASDDGEGNSNGT